ncbi:GNAT family N-acetyltransferase [Oleiagrimonas citrea]|uniref:GNAT family N-acetyltransferase n=1 Tax=Oleiagrimonas citrea TaxID=1665687 RepID=A0A846ZLM6_9GAMM|nr:GNAT family N-acetyltransferase [Oleiagrimonas citrea]NKZ38458.1 GNAT family N-acetyltransferase [Oleiagrimonas citrea]
MYPLPDLRTARTHIRLPREDDAERLLAYRLGNRAHLAPWEPERDEGYFSLEGCERAIAEQIAAAHADRAYPLLALDPDERAVVASFTFSNVARGIFQACHLGYGVAAEQQGKGVMFEVLQAGLSWAFEDLRMHRVMANYMPENQRSERLLQRLGFEREGYARSYLKIAGAWRDHVLTALLHPDARG